MFLQQKQTGVVKGRGCANGQKQRFYMDKDQVSAPTVATKSLFVTCLIDAMEKCDVATVDIPGAFMQANMDKEVHMKLEGKMINILHKIDLELYKRYTCIKKGKKTLYVRLRKALYGTVQAAMLFWKNLSTTLKSWGFEINPYDWCVANKMVNGKQIKIAWHVDDLKISHVNPKVVTDIIKKIDQKYGKDTRGHKRPLTIQRGKTHKTFRNI